MSYPSAPHPTAPHPTAPHPGAAYPGQPHPSAPYPGAAEVPQGHRAPSVAPYPSGGSAFGPPPGPRAPRRRPGWGGVGAAALAAALAASIATAGLTGALSPDAGSSSSFGTLGRQQISIPVSGSTADNPDWQVVAAAVRDSVVAIMVTTRSGSGEGSGVVIDASGLVVTNDHVVGGAANGGSITVSLADGRLYEADLVGTDPTTDIAVIRLIDPPQDLSVATLGDSSQAVVGAPVMAVGNPLGLDSTVTTGIISALDRPVSTREQGSDSAVVTNAIQVDAAVNPGNSGGPLFTSTGEVLGITSSIASLSNGAGGSTGSIGLGFAIPVNQVRLVADQLIATGTVEHAFLGVTLVDGTGTADGTTRRGAVVRTVSAGTPAAGAGLQPGDVVVGIDGNAVGSAESLTGYVRQYASGDTVVLTVIRGAQAIDVSASLATSPNV